MQRSMNVYAAALNKCARSHGDESQTPIYGPMRGNGERPGGKQGRSNGATGQ